MGPKARVIQFPIRLCYAQTSHKMQGDTVQPGFDLVIHWNKKLTDGMALVMLSRATRVEDVHIVGDFDRNSIKTDTVYALPETERLQNIFDEKEAEESAENEKHFKISYINVQSVKSLNGHRQDVMRDDALLEADILGLGETWLENGQTLDLEGYNGYFANSGKGKGVAGFSKIQLTAEPELFSTKLCSAIFLKTQEFDVIYLYLSEGYSKSSVFPMLDGWIRDDVPTVIMGDMNEDLLRKKFKLKDHLSCKGFTQLVEKATFDKGSLIDHIYINEPMMLKTVSIDQTPAYYSGHDVITLNVSKKC